MADSKTSELRMEETSQETLFDAFLSYSRQDMDVANELLRDLASQGANIAWDTKDLRGGEIWRRKLRNLIERSQNVVFLISPASLASLFCRWELDLAVSLNKRLIPVLAGAGTPVDLPESLRAVQWIDARGQGLKVAGDKLIEACRTDQTWTELHTQLGLRAKAWKEGGALLTRKELNTNNAAVIKYRGKRPSLTSDQSVFLFESRQAVRRRFWVTSVALLVTVLIVFFLGVNWWIEQRNARYIDLRRQGEKALVQLGQNDVAAAVASLGYVTQADRQHLLPEYGDVFSFWRPRLRPLDQVIQSVAKGELLVWQGRHYLKVDAQLMRSLPANEPFKMAVVDRGNKLLVVDYSGVTLLSLPSLQRLVEAKFTARLHPDAIYEIPGNGQYLVIGHHVVVENSEDEPTRTPTRFTIVSTHFSGKPDSHSTPTPVPTSEPDARDGEPDSPLPRLVTGADQTALITFATERTFVVDRCFGEAGQPIIIEGFQTVFDDSPRHVRLRLDVATMEKVEEEIQSTPGATPVSKDSPLPASRVIVFPQRVAESEFWTALARKDLPAELLTLANARDDLDRKLEAAIKASDFSGLDEPDAWRNRMGYDRIAGGIHEATGSRYLWVQCISGNSYGTFVVAKVLPTGRVESCRQLETQVIEAKFEVSRNQRWVAFASGNGPEQALSFIDVTDLKKITPREAPARLVVGMAFHGNSTRFAALTESDEIMFYSTEGVADPRLIRRVVIGTSPSSTPASNQPEQVTARPLVFAGDGTLVGLTKDKRLFGVDGETGEILWIRSIAPLADTASLRLIAARSSRFVAAVSVSDVQLFHSMTGAALTDPVNIYQSLRGISDADATASIDRDGILVAENGEFAFPIGKQFLMRRRQLGGEAKQSAPDVESITGISAADGRTPLAKLPIANSD